MMDAIYIVKNGKPKIAFERKPVDIKGPTNDEVAIEVEAFGLNFADVMARLGLYKDCPPLPAVVGYEVVGKITKLGSDVKNVLVGDRVVAFTRFGGYAQYVVTNSKAIVKIQEDYPVGKALALATQYCTAYYAAHVATNVMSNDKVLIQAAAGGVGTALIQLCKLKNCKIYGTAGSQQKLDYLEEQGVDIAINYREEDFSNVISEKLDVVFDSIGGTTFKKGFKLLGNGGRMVPFGAASQLEANNIFGKLKFALSFGFFHPISLIMQSKALVGVNMLRVADDKPDILQFCMQEVVKLAENGKIDPHVGAMYSINELNDAHNALENRKTVGKIGVKW